jgi:hypothetical protein
MPDAQDDKPKKKLSFEMPLKMSDKGSDRMLVNEPTRRKLQDLHKKLMHLHKALLDNERKDYERLNGPVQGSGTMLNLVMFDPFFDWLHRISEGIVKIDELLDDKEATLEDASDLLSALRGLFQANPENETPFMLRYKAALQHEPAAVLAHVEVQKVLLPDA